MKILRFNESLESEGWEVFVTSMEQQNRDPSVTHLDKDQLPPVRESGITDKHIKMLSNDIPKIVLNNGTQLRIDNDLYEKIQDEDYIGNDARKSKIFGEDIWGVVKFYPYTNTYYGHEVNLLNSAGLPNIKSAHLTFRRGLSMNNWEGHIKIVELEDEWFLVTFEVLRWVSRSKSVFYKCDQYYGLLNLIKYLVKKEMKYPELNKKD